MSDKFDPSQFHFDEDHFSNRKTMPLRLEAVDEAIRRAEEDTKHPPEIKAAYLRLLRNLRSWFSESEDA